MLLSMSKTYQSIEQKLHDTIYEQIGRIFPDDVHKSTMKALVTDLCNAAIKRDDFNAEERKFYARKKDMLIANITAKFKTK